MKGDGRIYRRGKIWWAQFYVKGQLKRESAKTDDKEVAKKFLRAKVGNAAQGIVELGMKADRVTLVDLVDALEADYSANANRSSRMIERVKQHLVDFFGEKARVSSITKVRIQKYVENRRTQLLKRLGVEQAPAVATINGELRLLKHAFRLLVAAKRLNVDDVPEIVIKVSKENVRKGFVNPPEFAKLREALPAYLKDPIMFLYRSGWRLNEMRTLEWGDVDLASRTVTLRPEMSKNGEPRTLILDTELAAMIERLAETRDESRALVFVRNDKHAIGDFRKNWAKACKAAGLNGIIVHDLRRSAVRNMIRAGIPQNVAMRMSGHKTASIFDRYNIVDESDLAAGAQKMDAFMDASTKDYRRKIYPLRKVS